MFPARKQRHVAVLLRRFIRHRAGIDVQPAHGDSDEILHVLRLQRLLRRSLATPHRSKCSEGGRTAAMGRGPSLDLSQHAQADRAGEAGLQLAQADSAAPVCSRRRTGLLAGQATAKSGSVDDLRPNSANALSTDDATLFEMLPRHSYPTELTGNRHWTDDEHHGPNMKSTEDSRR